MYLQYSTMQTDQQNHLFQGRIYNRRTLNWKTGKYSENQKTME